MNIYSQRIETLRQLMNHEGIDAFMIPTSDYHNSEYVGDFFKVREFFTGFTGSNGTLIVTANEAGLWTDGRYFIQAANELEGTGITLYKMGEPDCPTIIEYLDASLSNGQTFAFDGRCVSAVWGSKQSKKMASNNIKIRYDIDPASSIWMDRPELSAESIFVIGDELAGESISSKISRVREAYHKKNANAIITTKLDEIMWLLNIRGNDIECNPVALSFLYIDDNQVLLFIQKEEINETVNDYLKGSDIEIKEYQDFNGFIADLKNINSILIDINSVNYTVYKELEKVTKPVFADSVIEKMKAVKNSTELQNIRKTYIEDSAVVTRFIYWLKQNVKNQALTEYTAAMKLDSMRAELDGFIGLSFPTISAYKGNAAMMHYEAGEEDAAVINADGMLLVDSGGQYMGGTTDVTRTIVLGDISDEIRKHYTLATVGMLRLADAKFIYGCTGRNLDIIARAPLWNIGIDYKCGTGHGIGYILNVHEGPQNIRWRYSQEVKEAALEAGMIVSDEPGVYVEDSHGIRIENILEIQKGMETSDGQFMRFEHLTYVPIDLEAIDKKWMTAEDIMLLNEYHKNVYNMIKPFMQNELEEEWLRQATKAV